MARTKNRVTGVIIRDGKILLIHRFKNGKEYWVFPGGGVESGETLEEGLHREILEETNLKINRYTELFRNTDVRQNCCIFYYCEVGSGDPRLVGPELKAASDDNRYLLEWIPFTDLYNITDIYPDPDMGILKELYENL